MFSLLELSIETGNIGNLVRSPIATIANLIPFIAKTLPHFNKETSGINELNLALAFFSFRLVTTQTYVLMPVL